jgi:hypothetical protein
MCFSGELVVKKRSLIVLLLKQKVNNGIKSSNVSMYPMKSGLNHAND